MTSVNRPNEHAELEELIEKTANGDRDAFEMLYHQTRASVYAFALSVLKNSHDAEDVLQECFVNIHYYAGDYKAKGTPMAWIMTIAKNLCMQKFRQRKKEADFPEEDWMPYLEENEKISEEDRLVITEVMKTLNDEERQIVLLHAVSGFKHREIAKFLDLPLPTVLSKYHRSIKKLRQQLNCKE